ncbi:intercompartmental signaling factor BofC [Bacillus sp. 2205SS5-2]|uniref:intercompartmental signaling factor BofC n=1 Tax=Bacillus sp. 2205SS5-2 TaxID=3109031 RepID=UPI0030077139
MTIAFRAVFMILVVVGTIFFAFYQSAFEAKESETNIEEYEAVEVSAHTVTVILERMYLDGETSKEVLTETIWSMEDFWSQYTGWDLVEMNESTVVFQQELDDISPLLKSNGYFGISKEGTLTIFNGKPKQAKVIQSFFQIDVEKLESKTQEELAKGIPIDSKEKYVEVLDSFQTFKKTQ